MKKFLDCISIVGATPSKFHGTKKYVSTGAVAITEIDESEVVEVTYEDRPSRANLSAEAGDILFAKMQGTRKTLLLDSETEENIYSTGFYAVRANPEVITTECLYYLIDSELFLAQKDMNCSGATQKAITNGGMAKIEISVPALSEQGILVDKLKHLTQLIADKKKQLNLFDEIIKSRFIEMFGTLSCNEHHYPLCALKDACRKITDGKHGGCEQEYNSGYYYVGAREIYDGEIHYDTAPQIVRDDFEKDYRRCNLEQGDFVLVNTGATIGKSAIAKHPLTERTLLQKSVAMFKVKTELISAVFLKCCYDANPEMYTVKSASAQPNLLLSRINSTQIYLPPIELQRQFAAFVEQVDKSKFEIQQSLEKLEILKKSLMQQYFG